MCIHERAHTLEGTHTHTLLLGRTMGLVAIAALISRQRGSYANN